MADEYSQLSQLIGGLNSAFAELKRKVNGQSIEKTAVLIYEAMSTRTRLYHRVEHCLATPPHADALGRLAYFFHDVVYWQVDRARHELLRQYMGGAIPTEQGVVEIPRAPDLRKMDFSEANSISRAVFGLMRAQQLTFAKGMNEFLSSCIAENVLKGALDHWQIIEIAACIEATIPFRRPENGKTAIELLQERLSKINAVKGYARSEEEIRRCMARAVDVANHDVSNFAYEEPAVFLKNTWDLTWENNPTLQRETYTIKQYRAALQKNASFYVSVDPALVFSAVGAHPGAARLGKMAAKAKKNITIGLEYIRAKLLSAAIVESIADLTGGDAPLMLFMGKHPRFGISEIWQGLLDEAPALKKAGAGVRREVLGLLCTGREELNSHFDISRSPIGAYVYSSLTEKGFQRALERADKFFSGRLGPMEFLRAGPIHALVGPVFERMRALAISRRDAFDSLETQLPMRKAVRQRAI